MQTAPTSVTKGDASIPWYKDPVSAYDRWVIAQGIPIHQGHHIPNLRTVELGPWAERECSAAFLQLAGQEGVSEARVSEIPGGRNLPPLKLGFDELVYVVEGRGLTTISRELGGPSSSFEWETHSLFLVPRHYYHQMSNAQGQRPARLLHYNYLPFVMDAIPDASFYIDSTYAAPPAETTPLADLYSEARPIERDRPGGRGILWLGNFFPDLLAWDKLAGAGRRGVASHTVAMRYPNSPLTSHMAVFPPYTYKKAHRHGPGVVIIVITGEGQSAMWEEGEEKEFVSWEAGSVFVPPNRWFHQHFNVGATPARYLALHSAPSILGYSERVEDLARDQIEYTEEDPQIRASFAAELARRGLTSNMPEAVYLNRDYHTESL